MPTRETTNEEKTESDSEKVHPVGYEEPTCSYSSLGATNLSTQKQSKSDDEFYSEELFGDGVDDYKSEATVTCLEELEDDRKPPAKIN